MNIRNCGLRSADLKRLEDALASAPDAKLYIFGCAATALNVMDFIQKRSSVLEKLDSFVVDDAYYNRDTYCGKPVIPYSRWEKNVGKGDAVVIGYTDNAAAMKVLASLPENTEGVYFYLPVWYSDKRECMDFDEFSSRSDEFERLYSKLADEKSKQTMEAFLDCCINGNGSKLAALKESGQYFNDLTKNCRADNFIDCGAFVGDTIEEAVGFYGDRVKKFVSFEPDKINLAKLRERVNACGVTDDRLTLVAKGSWSCPDTLRFSSAGSSSGITDDGDIVIEVDSIDNILKKEGLSADYIKMDVEGSERQTLIGAAATIRMYHPTLAVCAYHKPWDLPELSAQIEEIAGSDVYNFYLRYYGPSLVELVLYAIPKDIK